MDRNRMLVGWRQIARYLDVDERTARRWEQDKDFPLPVGNNPNDPNTVVAYTMRLDIWRQQRATRPPKSKVRRRDRGMAA